MISFWDALWAEISYQFPDARLLARFTVRLTAAALLAGIIGWNRERTGKTAGLRTHMLVALGSALFVVSLVGTDHEGEAVSRAIQGIAAGIGFIGGGAILKREKERHVYGLTTASSIWLAAAIGVVAGLGKLGAALIALVLAWLILDVVERWKKANHISNGNEDDL